MLKIVGGIVFVINIFCGVFLDDMFNYFGDIYLECWNVGYFVIEYVLYNVEGGFFVKYGMLGKKVLE